MENTAEGKKHEMSNDELIKKVQEWVGKLAATGGRAWSLQVPVNFDTDPDMLILETCRRLAASQFKQHDGDGWVWTDELVKEYAVHLIVGKSEGITNADVHMKQFKQSKQTTKPLPAPPSK